MKDQTNKLLKTLSTKPPQLQGDTFQIPNMSGELTKSNVRAQATADEPYVPKVLYNTDATPPTASNFPVGTIYIQYTA